MSELEPKERLNQLIRFSNMVVVNPQIPPLRYYRFGLEMIRNANVYLSEGCLENAYVLYLKFMTIFLEKIRKHPDFKQVPATELSNNKALLREILPKAEQLKERLLKQYQEEHKKYQEEQKESKKKPQKETPTPTIKPTIPIPSAPSLNLIKQPNSLDTITYPDPNITPASSQTILPAQPSIDRSNKPQPQRRFDSTTLRTVKVPEKVLSQFQSLSQKNTNNNIETCGVLTGRLEQNELIITHLIVPKQKGTSDSCTTIKEEEIFDYQDQHDLITIGWIHTHPTQTAFLSSVDLHTHCPYQLLMPEAVAIVCAPKYKETGFFILTPGHGLELISNCRQSGFHPHPTEPPLFKVADHIVLQPNANLQVLDLRTL